jgi:hypothetical protein
LEFDVYDRHAGSFLSTSARRELLRDMPIAPVKVLFAGKLTSYKQLTDLLTSSHFISESALQRLHASAVDRGLQPDLTLRQTDASDKMEGLYIKVEENGVVTERYKFVRSSFLTTVVQSESHWLERPIIPNELIPGVDIFAQDGVRYDSFN